MLSEINLSGLPKYYKVHSISCAKNNHEMTITVNGWSTLNDTFIEQYIRQVNPIYSISADWSSQEHTS
jgi:hypothetical protein